MDVLASEPCVGVGASFFDRFLGSFRGDQAIATIADQVAASDFAEGIPDLEVVFGFEELHQGPLGFAVLQGPGDVNFFEAKRIQAGVVHARCDVQRGWDKVLHLIGLVPVAFEEQRQFDHRFDGTAWVRGDEIGDQELLFAGLCRCLFETLGEEFKVVVGGFAHLVKNVGIDMLWGDLKMPTDVMLGQFADVLWGTSCQIHSDSASDKHFLDTGQLSSLPHKLDHGLMVDPKELTDFRMDAGLSPADRFDLRSGAAHVVHVGRGASDVADDAFEILVLRHLADFVEHRFFGPRLDDPTLVGGDRAKSATTEAPAHDRHRILDHVESGNRLGVARVGPSGVGQSEDSIHRFLADGQSRDVADDGLSAMALDQASCVERVGLVVDHPCGDRKSDFVARDGFVGWQFESVLGDRLGGAEGIGDASHVPQILDTLAFFESSSHLDDRIFPHPECDQVGFGI